MQNAADNKQFSQDVIEYQNQIENIIAWLFGKEEELQQRPHESTLHDARFGQVLEEYSRHEKFITEFCEYSHTIMKLREDGQEMRENVDLFTEEDRDEIGIQMDTMEVCYEKLKILSTDRLRKLQEILEVRQQSKIEHFEEWLQAIEMKISSSNNIGPDYNAIQRQMKDMDDFRKELEQKQDFLNFMSSVIVFDEVDSESLQIRSRSCESLDHRLESMNRRWEEICRFVDDRNKRLKKAESIWRLLDLEGPQLIAWINKIDNSLIEVSDAAKPDIRADKGFVRKLISRFEKIDSDFKSKQAFYTSLENRVREEIERFDDPCSMVVIELERALEDMQDKWNAVMRRKRMLDYKLQALADPSPVQDLVECNMIPVPDPITSVSNNNLAFNNGPAADFEPKTEIHDTLDFPPRLDTGAKQLSVQLNGNYSETQKNFGNSLSSDSRSLVCGKFNNLDDQQSSLLNDLSTDHVDGVDIDSQDELSFTSMTASYPIDTAPLSQERLHLPNIGGHLGILDQNDARIRPDTHLRHQHQDGSHNCRVEEWKHSLESFSTWLKRVEISLAVNDPMENFVGFDVNRQHNHSWSQLDIFRRFLLLNEIENQINSTCQDEFDCLILQGQQIIEDLIPEIGENEYEANSKEILADIESRYQTVKGYLFERKRELANKDQWIRLLKALRASCDYLIGQMGQILPETNIGIDLINLAQQQDQLMHAKTDLEDNPMIQNSIQDAKLFLKVCDSLQQQELQKHDQSHNSLAKSTNIQQHIQINQAYPNNSNHSLETNDIDIWLSFKQLRQDIESQLDRLTLHHSELSQLIDDRLTRLDEVHKEMHALQHRMQELAEKLQVAEILKSNWLPLENLTIEKLSEQLEVLKLYRERLGDIETDHKIMNSIFEWMTQSEVPLSQQNLKRIGELNTIWSLIQASVEERQKSIEQAFDDQSGSEQQFLRQTVADLAPRWERRVATSKVPYFIDHDSNKTSWDHPKLEELLKTMSCVKQVVFSAYRTALKLRMVQKKFGIDLLMLEQLKEVLNSVLVNSSLEAQQQTMNGNDTLIGVEQIILYLKALYERIQNDEKPNLDVPLSIDLTLNWLLNLYDSTRTGYISVLSLKIGLALLCCATREEKYIFMYELVGNQRTGSVDARKLGTLFECCMRVPIYLGEGDSFGGPEIIETSIRNCFSMSKFNPQHPNSIDLVDYLNWLKSEPHFIIWLPVLHRLLISENTSHQVKCRLCGANPIIGLRYRCLKCFSYNICQNCFLTGRHIFEHLDPSKHPMQEYISKTNSGETVRDFTRILRNKLRSKA